MLFDRLDRRACGYRELRALNPHNATISVIVPTYNRPQLLVQALESVLGQTRPANEIVVVDDGSDAATATAVGNFRGRIGYVYQSNAGKAAAINQALNRVTGDYVCIVDDDDLLALDAFEQHLDFLSQRPDLHFSYSGVWYFDGLGPPPPSSKCRRFERDAVPPEDFLISAMELFPCVLQSMLVPRKCYSEVGVFDETLSRGQDYDMILRLAARFRGAKLPRPTTFVRTHAGERGPARERHRATERESVWRSYDKRIFLKLRQSLPLLQYLPARSCNEAMTPPERRRALLQRACIMARHGLIGESVRDLYDAVGQLPGVGFSKEELAICSRLFSASPARFTGHETLLREVGIYLHRMAPSLWRAAAVGAYWRFISELKAGCVADAGRAGVNFLRLTGVRRLPTLALEKTRRRALT
ncbi:MAG TPA: glycosyltransferase [Gammaproteobacteria bacterium]|nr:glycosyltransferase [Gammaproteobacteria bacterium]